jgi:hypothetical protein
MSTCPCCGKDITGVQREITMRTPDDVVELSDDERRRRVKVGGKSFQVLDDSRYFVRVLLPVPLDIGHEYRFGVWLEVAERDFEHLLAVWDDPSYLDTELDGMLANGVPPWGASILGAPCRASARRQEDALYIESSTDPALSRVLTHPWVVHECEALIAEVWGGD